MPDTPPFRPNASPHLEKEPGIAIEKDIPSDGKDEKGEQMIEELGQHRPEEESSEHSARKTHKESP